MRRVMLAIGLRDFNLFDIWGLGRGDSVQVSHVDGHASVPAVL